MPFCVLTAFSGSKNLCISDIWRNATRVKGALLAYPSSVIANLLETSPYIMLQCRVSAKFRSTNSDFINMSREYIIWKSSRISVTTWQRQTVLLTLNQSLTLVPKLSIGAQRIQPDTGHLLFIVFIVAWIKMLLSRFLSFLIAEETNNASIAEWWTKQWTLEDECAYGKLIYTNVPVFCVWYIYLLHIVMEIPNLRK